MAKKDDEFEKLVKDLKKQDPHFVNNITNESRAAGHKTRAGTPKSQTAILFTLVAFAIVAFGIGQALITLVLLACAVALGVLHPPTKFDMEERYEKRMRQR